MNEETRSNPLLLISRYRGAIMGFAALWIFFFHEWQPLLTGVPVLSFLEGFLKRIGFCGVDLFLLLSGIGMTFALEKTSTWRFYYNRFKRLLVPFLVVALIRCFLDGWSFVTFLKNITGISFYTRSMYSFLWFVTAIATFYLLVPLYYRVFKGASNKALFTTVVILFWLMLSLYFRNSPRQDLFGFTNRIPVFLIGIYLGWLTRHKRELRFDGVTWCFVWMMLIVGLYLAYLTNYKGLYLLVPVSNCCVPNLLLSVSLTLLLAKLFALLSEVRVVRLIGRPITWLYGFFGLFTLEFYCFQEWFTRLLLRRIGTAIPTLWVNVILLTTVTAVAFLLHLLQIPLWKWIDKGLTSIGILKPPLAMTVREKPTERAGDAHED